MARACFVSDFASARVRVRGKLRDAPLIAYDCRSYSWRFLCAIHLFLSDDKFNVSSNRPHSQSFLCRSSLGCIVDTFVQIHVDLAVCVEDVSIKSNHIDRHRTW